MYTCKCERPSCWEKLQMWRRRKNGLRRLGNRKGMESQATRVGLVMAKRKDMYPMGTCEKEQGWAACGTFIGGRR